MVVGSVDHSCIITSVYHPPNTEKDDSAFFIDFLTSIADYKCDLIVIGDFNFPLVNWLVPHATKKDGLLDAFQGIMTDELLRTQCVYEPTHAGNIIDLAFISHPNAVLDCHMLQSLAQESSPAIRRLLLSCQYTNVKTRKHILLIIDQSAYVRGVVKPRNV